MVKNPFGQDDPLAGGVSSNGGSAWGATGQAAGGFGASQSGAGAVEEYDVVEIADDHPPPAAGGRVTANGASFGGKPAKELAAREAALAKREQEVRRREAALASRGAAGINPMMIKNFPSCCPMVHHDITNDIPEYNKAVTRAGFLLFLGTTVTLTFNFICALLAVVASEVGSSVAAWFFAAIYMVIGIPGAWFTWYGRVYRAMMSDGALSFAGFFFTFLIHTAFCIWSAVSPGLAGQDYAHAGWLPAINLTKGDGGDKFVAIFYFVGASLWSLLSFFSITYMARVYNKMRGGNVAERARQEAYELGAQVAAQEAARNVGRR